MMALQSLMTAPASAGDGSVGGGVSSGSTHFPPRAKRMIWLFMHGGPSHVDLFDPKPDLIRYAGQPLPESFGEVMTRRKVATNPLLGPLKPFRPRGQSGLPVSDFLPKIAEHADDLCVIRSLHGDSVNHPQSVYQMNTGSILMGHPSLGSWLAYGLGTENADMPAFIVLPDPSGRVEGRPGGLGKRVSAGHLSGHDDAAGQYSRSESETAARDLRRPTAFNARFSATDESAALDGKRTGRRVVPRGSTLTNSPSVCR